MNVEKKVVNIISETLNIPEDKINSKDKLVDLVNDSIQLFELLIKFEEELGEKVSYDDISNIENVSDIINYAHKINFIPA